GMLPDRHCQLLTAYVDGELNARHRRQVEQLLSSSKEACDFLRKLERDAQALRKLPRPRPPPHLPDRPLPLLPPPPPPPPPCASTLRRPPGCARAPAPPAASPSLPRPPPPSSVSRPGRGWRPRPPSCWPSAWGLTSTSRAPREPRPSPRARPTQGPARWCPT